MLLADLFLLLLQYDLLQALCLGEFVEFRGQLGQFGAGGPVRLFLRCLAFALRVDLTGGPVGARRRVHAGQIGDRRIQGFALVLINARDDGLGEEPHAFVVWVDAGGVHVRIGAADGAHVADDERIGRGAREGDRGEHMPLSRDRLGISGIGDAAGTYAHDDARHGKQPLGFGDRVRDRLPHVGQ